MMKKRKKKKKGSGPRISRSHRKGLAFPVGRIHTFMKKLWRGRVGSAAAVYLTATTEYIAAEVLELAGYAARDVKRKRILPRHIMLAIRSDVELNELVGGRWVAGGGVLPLIKVSCPGMEKKSETQEGKKERT
tara:strand:+ start:245 stop:643 length:399 start_codon:yes stop_codon:yes gene_type:complete